MRLALTSNDIGYYEVKFASASTFIESEDNYTPSISERFFDWLVIRRLTNKIKEANQSLIKDLHLFDNGYVNEKAKEHCKGLHKSIYNFLNKFDQLDKLEIDNRRKTLVDLKSEVINFHSNLKDLELKLRLLVYPERNEVVFTYDELKELRESFKELQIHE